MSGRGEGDDLEAYDLLDEDDPFEVDDQNVHLFKHAVFGYEDALDVFRSDPIYFPDESDGPADWLMVAQVPGGDVLLVPLAAANYSGTTKMRPIGVYEAPRWLRDRYLEAR